MHGVQFFLPQYGINGKSFRDENYALASSDGSLDLWLDRASGYLHANLLRIFVDLPNRNLDGSVFEPTSYPTIHDIAQRAAQRGMRLGIVVHNSANWTMSPEQSAWIDATLASAIAQGDLARIAYISADNEINNHCSNSGGDCFDQGPGYNAQVYIDGAVGWTNAVRSIVRARAPQLLVTVGVATELADFDGVRAAFDSFRAASNGRSLATSADFLSPHNYSGQAGPIIDDIRIGQGYAGAVVLEEYGFPTDPAPRNPLWSEGPLSCRLAPFNIECRNTAPYFVALSTSTLATKSYAGGVAWMLADMREKNVTNACTQPNVPFDLWTGLFAIGGAYCAGGTYHRGDGQPKATALLVCVLHTGDLNQCDDPTFPFYRIRLPLIARP
jgi:hypothetical protein